MYEGDVNDIMVLNLLNDTGVIAPWEDVATRELDINLPMTGVVAQQTKQIKLTTTSISNSPVAAPFGPGEFYAHDIAESIRHDFGRLPVYVIDDVHAEELDDGVSIERIPSEPGFTWLHVHVADPTAILPPTHALSQQAYRQLETYYFVDRTIPMLPRGEIFERMSLGYASQSGQPENVMSFSMKVNEEGEIVDYKVRAGLVRNVKQLRYDDVDAAMGLPPVAISYPFGNPNASGQLQTPKYDSTTMEDLSLLRKVTRKLVDERVQNGAFTFTIGSVTMSIDPKPTFELLGTSRPSRFSGFPQMTYMVQEMAVQESGSRQIVAECMKSASRVASRFFRDRGIPAIRRSVAQMQTEVQGGMELLMASRDENGYAPYHTAVKLGIISPGSRYDLIPAAHSLLGVPDGEGYTRVTSPLRRFCDMIAHWQIKHALLSPSQPSSPLFSEDWLRRFADNLGMHESKTRRMQMVQNNFWAMRFLQRWIAEWEMGAHRDEPNPLDSLIAQSSGNVMLDWRTSTHQLQVFLPQLGLKATLNDINTDDQWDIGRLSR
ncbi:Exoribonuclease II, mitochondrial [Grifola frondosa]|uniref:Exoribonuclease II, mitochondrial n=1 Tax=Grifola frondosa TaxID=5627 RepID=A0A1C7M723_GRIFR|nr:Exoribonuclease II, mitochondrial [Grifola frondosa]